jgi:hypothetical protein
MAIIQSNIEHPATEETNMTETSVSEQPSQLTDTEMSTAENPQFHSDQSSTTEESGPIDELQSAFGAILAADKKIDPVPDYTSLSWEEYEIATRKPPKPIPRDDRPGIFAFFNFPRELRDRIYFHYLYRPEGVVYRRRTAISYLYEKITSSVTSLFLTNRQVYEEALQVFCRHNEVELVNRYHFRPRNGNNGKTAAGTLRLFPDKHARLLQHVNVSFSHYMFIYYPRTDRNTGEQTTLPTGEAFKEILRDTYAFKDTFPKLREFKVCFCGYQDFFGTSSLFEIAGDTDEDKIGECMKMMKWWLGDSQIVPPKEFRFCFDATWSYPHLRPQEGLFNEAYARLVRERMRSVEALEDSGRLWIEEMGGKERRRRRRRRRRADTCTGT